MGIRASNVTKRFGDFVALDDVSVEIPTGSLTALLGPSGGGKSTLLRIIAGLEHPDAGTVEIEGEDSTGLPPQRRNVGFVFQHYAAFKHLTVRRNVSCGLEIRKPPKDEIRRRVHELLELVHLEQFADRFPSQLSGGQRQRMALARALAVEPGSCCSTSRSAPSTPRCGRSCATGCAASTTRSTSPPSSSPMTRRRRWTSPTRSSSPTTASSSRSARPTSSTTGANDFVMSFLGPVTKIRGKLVRPHDLEILGAPEPGTVPAEVTRLVRLGFEVRVDAVADGEPVWVQLTRGEVDRLGLAPGRSVHVRHVAPTGAPAATAG